MGWHASSMRRAVVVTCIGLLVAVVLVWLGELGAPPSTAAH
jgi:hypothetical protein